MLCAAFRYAQGRHTDAMGTVVSYICKQLDRMNLIDTCELAHEVDSRKKYGGPWGFQEEKQMSRLEKELKKRVVSYET